MTNTIERLNSGFGQGLSGLMVVAETVDNSSSDVLETAYNVAKKIANKTKNVANEKGIKVKDFDASYLDRIKQLEKLTRQQRTPTPVGIIKEDEKASVTTLAKKQASQAPPRKLTLITEDFAKKNLPKLEPSKRLNQIKHQPLLVSTAVNNVVNTLTKPTVEKPKVEKPVIEKPTYGKLIVRSINGDGDLIDESTYTVKLTKDNGTGQYNPIFITDDYLLHSNGYDLTSDVPDHVVFESETYTLTLVYEAINNKFSTYDDSTSEDIIEPDDYDYTSDVYSHEEDTEDEDEEAVIPLKPQVPDPIEVEHKVVRRIVFKHGETVIHEEEQVAVFDGLDDGEEIEWTQTFIELEPVSLDSQEFVEIEPVESLIVFPSETELMVEEVACQPILEERYEEETRKYVFKDEFGNEISSPVNQTRQVIILIDNKAKTMSKEYTDWAPSFEPVDLDGYELDTVDDGDDSLIVLTYKERVNIEEQYEEDITDVVYEPVILPDLNDIAWSYTHRIYEDFVPVIEGDFDFTAEKLAIVMGNKNPIIGESRDKLTVFNDRYANRLYQRVNNLRYEHGLNPVLLRVSDDDLFIEGLNNHLRGTEATDNSFNVGKTTLVGFGEGITPEAIADNVFMNADLNLLLNEDVTVLTAHLIVDNYQILPLNQEPFVNVLQHKYDISIVNRLG